jgi:hypothetical protein
MIDEVSAWCRQRGITLEIETSEDEGPVHPERVPVVTIVEEPTEVEIMGYIRDLYDKDGQPHISFDEIEWFSGDDAGKAMQENGLCDSSDPSCEPPNPFYIRNREETTTEYRVSEGVLILMQTLSHAPDGNFESNERIDLDRFRQVFNDDSLAHLRSVPYLISIDSGLVSSIREQYVP